jgi:hypothetical protein
MTIVAKIDPGPILDIWYASANASNPRHIDRIPGAELERIYALYLALKQNNLKQIAGPSMIDPEIYVRIQVNPNP